MCTMVVFVIILVSVRKTFEAVLPWGACCQGEPPVDLGLDDECDKNAILGGWDGIGSLSGVRYGAPYHGDNAEGDEECEDVED